MTSIRDLFSDPLRVGETFRLDLEERDDRLVAEHPDPNSPVDVAVVEGLERLETRGGEPIAPAEPVRVEILGRFVENRVAGRVVDPSEEESASEMEAAPDG